MLANKCAVAGPVCLSTSCAAAAAALCVQVSAVQQALTLLGQSLTDMQLAAAAIVQGTGDQVLEHVRAHQGSALSLYFTSITRLL